MNMDDMKATLNEADRDTVMNEAYADWLKLSDVLHLFFDFIDSFDGSSTAFDTAEPMMDKIFHQKFTFLTDDGLKNLDWYRGFCKAFAANGSIAQVMDIDTWGKNGIQVTIKNVVAGTEIDPIVFDGVAVKVNDGQYKIIYFEAVADDDEFLDDMKNEENVEKMIKLVAEHEKNSTDAL